MSTAVLQHMIGQVLLAIWCVGKFKG